MPNGKSHCENGEAKGQGNTVQTNTQTGKCRREYRATAAAQNKPKSSKKFSTVFIHFVSFVVEKSLAKRGACLGRLTSRSNAMWTAKFG
jgi:hypothetical protein